MTGADIGYCPCLLARSGAFSVGPLHVTQGFVIFMAVLIGVTLILSHRFRTRHDKYQETK